MTTLAAKKLRLGVVQKALTLLLAPFVLNAILIALLNQAIDRSDKLMDLRLNESSVVQQTNNMLVHLAEVLSAGIAYAALHKAKDLEKANYQLDKMKLTVENIRALPKQDTNDELIQSMVGLLDTGIALTKTVSQNTELGANDNFEQFKVLSKYKDDIARRHEKLLQLMSEKEILLDTVSKQEEDAGKSVLFLVQLSFAANVLLAMLIAGSFFQDITIRLAALVHNAKKIPLNLPIVRCVGGNDELTDLDATLNKASAELIEAREYRKLIMNMMAHDLRSPLSSCRIALDLLSTELREKISPTGAAELARTSNSLERLILLINELLLLDKLEEGMLELKLSPENIKVVAAEAIDAVAALAKKKQITLINEVKRDYALFDRERILQVLVNLLSNAIKFSPENSSIKIQTSTTYNKLKVTVCDNGTGLNQAERRRLFQKFYQTETGKEAGGTGLGLAICKLIVDSHGGTIGVDSASGEGSKFWFSIPLEASNTSTDS